MKAIRRCQGECGEEKSIEAFRVRTKNGRPYTERTCMECRRTETQVWRDANRARFNETSRARATARRPEIRASRRARYAATGGSQAYGHNVTMKYGITPAERDRMEEEQGGLCAICGRPERALHKGKLRRLAVDHYVNAAGEKIVRGLLCFYCNVGLGKFDEDPALLGRAIAYLEVRGTPVLDDLD